MEKDGFFMNQENGIHTSWFGMEIQSNELNCSSSEQLSNSFFNRNWDNPMDHNDPFESALSSIVSSPVNSSAGIPVPSTGVGDENIVLRELIGRLGSLRNSCEISPHQSYITSTNTSNYNTPLNSPPKLNLMDYQIRGNFPILANHQLPAHPTLSTLTSDPGFAERAARFSCFGASESEKLSRVSSRNSFKVSGVQENIDTNSVSDKKFSRLAVPGAKENVEIGDSVAESSVSDMIPSNAKKRKSAPKGKGKEASSTPSTNDAKNGVEKEESDTKRSKSSSDGQNENEKQTEKNPKPPAEPPKDYIHVRARRGQATDSHSLAERVRREKISERMKFLQDLVPGCNKVTGKAVMLDEIINYVQSLQRQVEFLSMKLATINPRIDINVEALLSKDMFHSRGSVMHNMYPLETSALSTPFAFQSQYNAIHSGAHYPFSVNPLTSPIQRSSSMKLPHIDGCGETASQVSAIWESDLQSVVEMGLVQNPPQNFHGELKTVKTGLSMNKLFTHSLYLI